MATCSSRNHSPDHSPSLDLTMASKNLKPQTLLCNSKVWFAGASVFIYFFSVSGAMHNIITSTPMFLLHPKDPSKLVFFYKGTLMQLGVEGFAVGFLYTIVGLLLAFVTHALINVRSVSQQRLMTILSLLISFCVVNEVIYLVNWKTFYDVHGFWPSSWK